MKKILATFAAAAVSAAGVAAPAMADDEVKLQLQWVTQAQFAGYYVALEKGFYDEEGLDDLQWRGAQEEFKQLCQELGAADLPDRIHSWISVQ